MSNFFKKTNNLIRFLVKTISVKIELHDHEGICNVTPFYGVRFFFCLSSSPNEDVKNMKKLCKDLVNNHKSNYSESNRIHYEEILNHRLTNLKVFKNPTIFHQYNAEFFVEKSGYFIIIFRNYCILNRMLFPVRIY